jgi:hypothetical protein
MQPVCNHDEGSVWAKAAIISQPDSELCKKIKNMKMLKSPLILLGMASACLTAQAGTQGVNSAAALNANDSVNWAQLGSTFTVIPTPVTALSAGALDVTVSSSLGSVGRRDEGNGWAGNFTPGDQLLWNQDQSESIDIAFATPVAGAGAQIQADTYGPFSGTLTAYGAGLSVLDTYNFTGVSNGDNDGSAIFAGMLSSTPDIYGVSFEMDGGDLAIDTLFLNTTNTTSGVPDGGLTLALLGTAFSGMAVLRRKP